MGLGEIVPGPGRPLGISAPRTTGWGMRLWHLRRPPDDEASKRAQKPRGGGKGVGRRPRLLARLGGGGAAAPPPSRRGLGTVVSHLEWEAIGYVEPTHGVEVFSAGLAEALEGWQPEEGALEFTEEEYAAFGIHEPIGARSYVAAQAKGEPTLFYRPVVRTSMAPPPVEKVQWASAPPTRRRSRKRLLTSLPALLVCVMCLLLIIIAILAAVMAAEQVAGC